jgi:UDP-N-acetylmuramate dehydrogenase
MGENNYKVSAAWLIDNCDLKGLTAGGMRVYEKNPLVIVNDSANTFASLDEIRDIIKGKVRDKFRIDLEQEPEEIEP